VAQVRAGEGAELDEFLAGVLAHLEAVVAELAGERGSALLVLGAEGALAEELQQTRGVYGTAGVLEQLLVLGVFGRGLLRRGRGREQQQGRGGEEAGQAGQAGHGALLRQGRATHATSIPAGAGAP